METSRSLPLNSKFPATHSAAASQCFLAQLPPSPSQLMPDSYWRHSSRQLTSVYYYLPVGAKYWWVGRWKYRPVRQIALLSLYHNVPFSAVTARHCIESPLVATSINMKLGVALGTAVPAKLSGTKPSLQGLFCRKFREGSERLFRDILIELRRPDFRSCRQTIT